MSLSAWVYEMRVGVYLKLASFTIISNLCWLLRTASLDVHEPRSNAQMLWVTYMYSLLFNYIYGYLNSYYYHDLKKIGKHSLVILLHLY